MDVDARYSAFVAGLGSLNSHPLSDLQENQQVPNDGNTSNCISWEDFQPTEWSLYPFALSNEHNASGPVGQYGRVPNEQQGDWHLSPLDHGSGQELNMQYHVASPQSQPAYSDEPSPRSSHQQLPQVTKSPTEAPKAVQKRNSRVVDRSAPKQKRRPKSRQLDCIGTPSERNEDQSDEAGDSNGDVDGGDDGRQSSRKLPHGAERARIQERNRLAATKHRKLKRQTIQKLEADQNDIMARRDDLSENIKTLRDELCQLRMMLLQHQDCGCTLIQKYLRRKAHLYVTGQNLEQ
ncbi:hypothetical protein G7046_g4393 [Stylonectria norvegica]|nr:hypothetical protein G7046_g4393 [Stylonectria norvegica]